MKKTLIISLLLILLINNYILASSFTDIDNHWAKENIENLVNIGVITGYPDGTFKPDNDVSRAEAIKLLLISKTGVDLGLNKDGFWADNYINDAIGRDYVLEDEFDDYNKPMSRSELARLIVRALEEEYPENINEYSKQIKDYSSITMTDKEYVLKAFVKGIITGYPDETFKPNNNVTRAEAVTMLVRFTESDKRIIPGIEEEKETEQANNDFTPTIDREKIIEELKKYPTDYPDRENYNRPPAYFTYDEKRKDLTYANELFVDSLNSPDFDYSMGNSPLKYWLVYDYTVDLIELLFNRDYEDIDASYRNNLIKYYRDWLSYKGIKHTPDTFVDTWIKETKDYKIKQESIFVTDKSLMYSGYDTDVNVRGRLFFRYINHEKPDNISFELEKEDESFEVGKWYSVDVDVKWWRPFSNVKYTHKATEHTLYTYSDYLSNFQIISK